MGLFKDTPQAPAAPDPARTAAAQSQTNRETAVTQTGLNAIDQRTPYGNLSYSQNGTWADGTPRFAATQTLSPEQQRLYNLSTTTQENLGNIGVEQSGRIRGVLNSPFDLNASIGTQQSDVARKLLDPVWDQRQAALDTSLRNQGVMPGTEAYTNATRDFGMQRDNSYNSALLAGRGQAATEALAQRNQPLNEIGALLSNSGVQQPNFTNTPQTNVAPTDYMGAVNMQQSALNNQYNTQVGANNAVWGALGGLGGAALGGWASGGFRR
ncbi:MAG: hypothetical protein WC213_00280 [Arenimonas sp.]|jgi:hypothetical protein